jgi:hypothetical protein
MAKYAYHRSDANQQEIIDALEARGVSVARIGRPLDLLCGFRNANYLLEVKRPKGRVEVSQQRFLAGWNGQAVVVRSVADALAAIGFYEPR